MRWNCPHCGIALAVSDDKLGTGWSFSRCFKCGGFALVRRSDINLIKIDKAPPGERVILPENTEEPRLSQNATQHLQQIQANSGVNAAMNARQNANTNLNQERQLQANAKQAIANALAATTNAATNHAQPQIKPAAPRANALPEPLPEEPERKSRFRVLPVAIGLTALMTISSGVYLYREGQQLWHKARGAAVNEQRLTLRPAAARVSLPDPAIAAPVVDTVHQNAMAPDRQVQLEAAPAAPAPASTTPNMIVRTRTRASLRSGPGLNFPILGVSNPQAQYLVKEWKGQWFQVEIPQTAKTAWVRNDLIEMVPQQQNDLRAESSDLTP